MSTPSSYTPSAYSAAPAPPAYSAATAVVANPLYTPVTLTLRAENLPDMDLLSKSDPRCVVYSLAPKNPGYGFKPANGNFHAVETFSTERVMNDLNPHWRNVMTMNHQFESAQWLFFRVEDVDRKHSADRRDQDFLGGVMATLGDIVNGQKDDWCKLRLVKGDGTPVSDKKGNPSYLCIHVTIMPRVSYEFTGQCRFVLTKPRFFGSNAVFFTVKNQAGQQFYESTKRDCDKKDGVRYADYPLFVIEGQHAKSTVWTFAHDHSDSDPIGTVALSEEQLAAMRDGSTVNVRNRRDELTGQLVFTTLQKRATEEKIGDSIVQRIIDGHRFSVVVAVDYTGSNGDPRDSGSLHYISERNQYLNSIEGILPIIGQYDDDGKIPYYGFGMGYSNGVSHCQCLTEAALGADGVIACYKNSIQDLKQGVFVLSGPTYFAPVINETIARVQASKAAFEAAAEAEVALNPSIPRKQHKEYTVLVLFTDGAILDPTETISAIVAASYLPISILIVGVGDANFATMNMLDNDGKPPLKDSNQRPARRDIVQFVPMRECLTAAELQKQTLAELPKQVLEYYR